jgi:hypothetical protein
MNAAAVIRAPVATQPTIARITVGVSGVAARFAMKAATAISSASLTRKIHLEMRGG